MIKRNFTYSQGCGYQSMINTWKHKTRLMSSVSRKVAHPIYKQIIAIGDRIVPHLLADLKENGPDDWFWALTSITGENPITAEISGNMKAMTEAWLEWGQKRGYLRG